jgi:hypothetical protein
MARRFNARRGICRHRNYTVADAARILGASRLTVRRWLKQGLPALLQKPALILGEDLIDFLESRRPRKVHCAPHELFCFSCRQPRAPAFGELEFRAGGKAGGNLRALCETCPAVMHKRVSGAALDQLRATFQVTIVQAGGHLGESHDPSLNDHLHEER